VHADVSAAWERVVKQWDDTAAHETLMGLVAKHSCYAWAASRYKERAGDPIADKQLQRLRKAATASLLATATTRHDPDETPYKRTLIWFVVLVVMLVLGLVFTRIVTQNAPPKPPTPVRP
jgi:hypothetical protein